MSVTCPECGEEIEVEDGHTYDWVQPAFKTHEEKILKPFKELIENWRIKADELNENGVRENTSKAEGFEKCANELERIIRKAETTEQLEGKA